MDRPDNFHDFYLYYLTQHQNHICRLFHAIGTSLVITTLVIIVFTSAWKYLFLLPVFGYGFSWIGHFGFERNKPAAFKHPFYSLISDFVMNWHIWSGKINSKLDEARAFYRTSSL